MAHQNEGSRETHAVVADPRNASLKVSLCTAFRPLQNKSTVLTNIQIGIRDGVIGQFKLVPREQALVSVFDSNFLIGDGIWVWY